MGPLAVDQQALTVCPQGATVKGVDVSSYQPNTDWAQVKASGRLFALIKATEDTGYTNAYFQHDWQGTKANGIFRSAYHFFRPGSDGVAQADYFLSVTGTDMTGDLPPMLDMEVTDGVAPATIAQRAMDWLNTVKAKTGKNPIIYTSPSFWDSTLGAPGGFAQFNLHVANWGVSCPSVPGQWTNWQVWQFTDADSVPGISGGVDGDYFNGSAAQLAAFAGATVAPALPQITGNDALTMVTWDDGHLEAFGRSKTGDLLHAWTSGTTNTWNAGTSLGTGSACGSAAIFWPSPWTYPEVFSPKEDGTSAHLWFANGAWGPYQAMTGGSGLTHFATGTWLDGHTEVYALGPNGDVWRNAWDLSASNWTGWSSLGGVLGTGPSVIRWNDGHMELFGTAPDHTVWHKWTGNYPNTWSPWTSMGGSLASRPVPVRWDDGHVEVFGRDTHGVVSQSSFDATSGWSAFSVVDPDTQTLGEPAVIANPSRGPEVFIRDATGRIVHAWWNGTAYTPFTPLGDQVVASDPFGWTRKNGSAVVLAVDESGNLVETARDLQNAWSPWSAIAQGYAPCTDQVTPPPPPADAGTPAVDSGTPGQSADGGATPAPLPNPKIHGGCGCASGAEMFWALAGLLAPALARRRRAA